MTLGEIAEHLGCRLEGEGSVEIHGVAALEDAGPGQITFFANARYAAALRATRAAAVIAAHAVEGVPCAVLRAADPYLAFARAVELFADAWRPAAGVHSQAVVDGSAEVAADASIGPFAVVGEGARIGARTIVHAHVTIGRFARIGEDCLLHSHVSIRERVRIGDRVILQNGVVIGADGYGFARRADGSHHKIPQIGGVTIEDDVEIGANSTVDRPAVGETRISAGTKIDNLVQVAHGVRVGRHVLLAAQVGVAGSSVLEDQVTLAGQVGVAGHLTIGRGTIATAQTGIPNSVEAGSFISGYPAIPNREWLKASAVFRKLPELRKLVGELQRRVADLECAPADDP
ncbi:MAG: UDP-3-O-(3-hydroxymyristoyl)glucosamine N-acyltransferase [Acidobacteria bacterium]|nr:UDP-3-O-(3-hydroxymyristoyl)glucosamine N-acyltransferase [Acidobacteriota bacterium]